jgi:hypothetical protein
VATLRDVKVVGGRHWAGSIQSLDGKLLCTKTFLSVTAKLTVHVKSPSVAESVQKATSFSGAPPRDRILFLLGYLG